MDISKNVNQMENLRYSLKWAEKVFSLIDLKSLFES